MYIYAYIYIYLICIYIYTYAYVCEYKSMGLLRGSDLIPRPRHMIAPQFQTATATADVREAQMMMGASKFYVTWSFHKILCIYIYIYLNRCIYIYTYIYIYTFRDTTKKNRSIESNASKTVKLFWLVQAALLWGGQGIKSCSNQTITRCCVWSQLANPGLEKPLGTWYR